MSGLTELAAEYVGDGVEYADEDMLTSKDIARYCGLTSRDGVNKAARRGTLKIHHQDGRFKYYRFADVKEWRENARVYKQGKVIAVPDPVKCEECRKMEAFDESDVFKGRALCRECLCPPISDEEIEAHFQMTLSSNMSTIDFVEERTPWYNSDDRTVTHRKIDIKKIPVIIKEYRGTGRTLEEVGEKYGLSAASIGGIIRRYEGRQQ